MNSSDFLTSSKVTMVVNSCDAYKDVWPLFFKAIDEYWPERNFDIVINAESQLLDIKEDGGPSLHFDSGLSGDDWGARLIKTLNHIKTEYVIMVFDDYILESMIDVCKVNDIIHFMDVNTNAAVYYLNAVCLKSHVDDENSSYRLLKDRVDYRLNSAPAVWRRKDLMSYVGIADNPWAWEVFGSYRTFGDGKDFYSPSSIKNNIYDYQYKKGGAIYRGKWVSDVVFLKNKKYSLNMDFSKRGFSVDDTFEKRGVIWKLRFLLLGFNMVGFRAVYFVINAIKAKLNVK